jgi:hypothetical protein
MWMMMMGGMKLLEKNIHHSYTAMLWSAPRRTSCRRESVCAAEQIRSDAERYFPDMLTVFCLGNDRSCSGI